MTGRVDSAARSIEAPSDAVYGALADRDALERWLAPGGMSARVLDFDFREGGSYRMRLQYRDAGEGRGKTTDDADEVEVQFARLIPKRRIEQLVTFASADPAYAGTMKMTWDSSRAARRRSCPYAARMSPRASVRRTTPLAWRRRSRIWRSTYVRRGRGTRRKLPTDRAAC